jgi:hypothetical protein
VLSALLSIFVAVDHYPQDGVIDCIPDAKNQVDEADQLNIQPDNIRVILDIGIVGNAKKNLARLLIFPSWLSLLNTTLTFFQI